MHKPLLSGVGVLALSGCATGPGYVRPELTAPERHARSDATLISDAAPEAEFWHGLGDPLLTRLVGETLSANHDLRIALARYDQARALLRQRRLDRLRTVTAAAVASDRRLSIGQAAGVPGAPRDVESCEAPERLPAAALAGH